MKTFRFPLLAGLLATLCTLTPAAFALSAGDRAPEIAATANGAPLKMAALRGQVVLVDFWASWCGPCKQSFPWLNAMHAKYAAQGLRIVGVNVDTKREDAERFLAQVPAKFPLAYDPRGETPAAWQVKAMPSSVLVGADGRVLHVHAGFREDEAAALEARIAAALADRK